MKIFPSEDGDGNKKKGKNNKTGGKCPHPPMTKAKLNILQKSCPFQ